MKPPLIKIGRFVRQSYKQETNSFSRTVLFSIIFHLFALFCSKMVNRSFKIGFLKNLLSMHFERKCVDIDSICLRYKELIQMLYNIGIEFSEAFVRAVIFFFNEGKD